MAKIIRTQTYKRGFLAKAMEWLFILFNLNMIAYFCFSLRDTPRGCGRHTGGVIIVWIMGVVILGALAHATREKVIVEEIEERI